MAESDKPGTRSDGTAASMEAVPPLVFISHDSRDAPLAEAFAKLLNMDHRSRVTH